MRRRRVVVGLVVLALVAVAAVALWPRGPRPCRATFEQVQYGRTFEEVCATVGGPPGDYSDGYSCMMWMGGPRAGRTWLSDDGELYAEFDATGRVTHAHADRACRGIKPPLWDRMLARLGL
jgi:hypothetical protein